MLLRRTPPSPRRDNQLLPMINSSNNNYSNNTLVAVLDIWLVINSFLFCRSNHFSDFGLANVKGRFMFIVAITSKLKQGQASLARDYGLAGKLTTFFDRQGHPAQTIHRRYLEANNNTTTQLNFRNNKDNTTGFPLLSCVWMLIKFLFSVIPYVRFCIYLVYFRSRFYFFASHFKHFISSAA